MVKAHVSVITLGVTDLERAKQFYCDLGWPIAQDYDKWVSFSLDDGASALGFIPRDMLAAIQALLRTATASAASRCRTWFAATTASPT